MTVKELYEIIGSDYDNVIGRLASERLVAKFVLKFLEDKTAAELKEAIENGDIAATFRAAHTMKGVSANLAFTEMEKQSEIITEATRDVPGRNPAITPEVKAALEVLYASYEKTVAAIKDFASQQ